jgi:hypothetical protein
LRVISGADTSGKGQTVISNFTAKLHESAISVMPVMALVVILHYTIAPMGEGHLAPFLIGGGLLIFGLAIFLIGAELGMAPFGQRVGSALTHKRSLPLLLIASFAIGFVVTIAEPDVQVLAMQVNAVEPSVNKTLLVVLIAVGVGAFLVVGAARTVLQLPLSRLLIGFYALVFLACAFIDPAFIGVAFDASGATTGPITVPFIMALGIGVAAAARKKEGDDSSFGMVGLASIGPIAAVVCMGMLSDGLGEGEHEAAMQASLPLLERFGRLLPEVIHEMLMALLPLLGIFAFFQIVLLRLPFQQVKRMVLGLVYTFIGLVIFMAGVKGGFIAAGQALGMALGGLSGGGALIPVGMLLCAMVVCAEPAVWVLNAQVEDLSGGSIRRSAMLVTLSVSIALAVGLGMLRVITGLSIWWALLPGFALALALTRWCPPLFTAIAFDSGGVASGPMSTTFVLSLTLGASQAIGGNPATDAFGMIAMIAMAPLVTIQVLGLIFKHLESKAKAKRAQEASQ